VGNLTGVLNSVDILIVLEESADLDHAGEEEDDHLGGEEHKVGCATGAQVLLGIVELDGGPQVVQYCDQT